MRFVDNTKSIREEFFDFISTDRVTGEILACNIKSTLVGVENCRGQGYDGALNMSARHGVQGINQCIIHACSL